MDLKTQKPVLTRLTAMEMTPHGPQRQMRSLWLRTEAVRLTCWHSAAADSKRGAQGAGVHLRLPRCRLGHSSATSTDDCCLPPSVDLKKAGDPPLGVRHETRSPGLICVGRQWLS